MTLARQTKPFRPLARNVRIKPHVMPQPRQLPRQVKHVKTTGGNYGNTHLSVASTVRPSFLMDSNIRFTRSGQSSGVPNSWRSRKARAESPGRCRQPAGQNCSLRTSMFGCGGNSSAFALCAPVGETTPASPRWPESANWVPAADSRRGWCIGGKEFSTCNVNIFWSSSHQPPIYLADSLFGDYAAPPCVTDNSSPKPGLFQNVQTFALQ